MEKTKLYRETNEKFRDRVFMMLFDICGCSNERALEVIKEVEKKIKQKQRK